MAKQTRRVTTINFGDKYDYSEKENNYTKLSNKIVLQACDDYVRLLTGNSLCPPCKTVKIKDLERFFLSNLFKVYSNLDGEELMLRLRAEAKNMIR